MGLSMLPLREREIARILLSRGEASAAELCGALSDPLSNAAVRSMLRRLENKGVVRRRREGKRFLYAATVSEHSERESVLRRVAREYFGGSLAEAALALADMIGRNDPMAARRVQRRIRRRSAAAQKTPTIQSVATAASAAAA